MGVDDTDPAGAQSAEEDEKLDGKKEEGISVNSTEPEPQPQSNQPTPATKDNKESIEDASSLRQEPDTHPEKGPDEVYCQSCGKPIKKEAEICPECGVRQNETDKSGRVEKNPGLAAVGSALITGVGQIYNGQIMKGIGLMLLQAINVALMFVVIGFFTFFATWVYGIYDAYKTAEKINNGDITV